MSIGCVYHEIQAVFQEINVINDEDKRMIPRLGESIINDVVESLSSRLLENWDLYEGIDKIFWGIEECLMSKRAGNGGSMDIEKFQGTSVVHRTEGATAKNRSFQSNQKSEE